MLKRLWRRFTETTNEKEEVTTAPLDVYVASKQVSRKAPICMAPWSSLTFNLDGTATVCCLNRKTTVSTQGKTIDEVWNSTEFETLRERVLNRDLSYDCGSCKNKIEGGNFDGVKARDYDVYFPNGARPQIMEFCLDNTCNLECVMCSSVYSSSIRKRNGLPPHKRLFGEPFLIQLEEYIPHLKEAVFAGGEPFLIPLYFKIWEKMLELNPNMIISVVTNGSTLNPRIKNLLERGRFRINISIDSFNRETYLQIRKNANYDSLLDNFHWFKEYGERKDLTINIPICPMTLNSETLPEDLRFANENNVNVNFLEVERPKSLALMHASKEELKRLQIFYKNQVFEASKTSEQNIKRFNGFVSDIGRWAQRETDELVVDEVARTFDSWAQKAKEYKGEGASMVIEETIPKITRAFRNTPQDRHDTIVQALHEFTIERIHHNTKNLNHTEVRNLFMELSGGV